MTRYAVDARERGVPIERAIVTLKEVVTDTLRAARPQMEAAPLREKAVGWCAEAYFHHGDDSGGERAGIGGLTLLP